MRTHPPNHAPGSQKPHPFLTARPLQFVNHKPCVPGGDTPRPGAPPTRVDPAHFRGRAGFMEPLRPSAALRPIKGGGLDWGLGPVQAQKTGNAKSLRQCNHDYLRPRTAQCLVLGVTLRQGEQEAGDQSISLQ